MVLDIAVEAGRVMTSKSGCSHQAEEGSTKLLHLPSQEQFMELVTTIRKSDSGVVVLSRLRI